MYSQAKQKAAHDVLAKYREFYPGDGVLVRDHRKEDTWWQRSVAERSGPRSCVVVLNDGRVGEDVMDFQAKQKATHDVQAKFREFYPGDRVLVRDLRKEDTWWPGSVAERSGPRSCVVVLNDGRVWKCHVGTDSMDRAVSDPIREMESQDNPPIFHFACVFQTLRATSWFSKCT